MAALGFVIEDRGHCRCVVWDNGGGVKPATITECALWDALNTQPPTIGADVTVEMVDRLMGDVPRQRELARRLIASGQKAAHVSCSETHEISEFVDDACDYIERTTAAPSRTRGEEG